MDTRAIPEPPPWGTKPQTTQSHTVNSASKLCTTDCHTVKLTRASRKNTPSHDSADSIPDNSTVNKPPKNIAGYINIEVVNNSVRTSCFLKKESFFHTLNKESAIADFEQFIPKEKSFAVFFDFDNTLKGPFISQDQKPQLRGGKNQEQKNKLNSIKNAEWCKGFYIITAGALNIKTLQGVTWDEIIKLDIADLFKSAKEIYPETEDFKRVGNVIGSRNKSDALKQILRQDFAEAPPEYIIFIDDNFDNAVDVFLGISELTSQQTEGNLENTNVISIHFSSEHKGETEQSRKFVDPILKALEEKRNGLQDKSVDKAK